MSKSDKLKILLENRCFYRESFKRKKWLKIGGPLCRVSKAFIEIACKRLTGLKCDIDFIQNHEEKNVCSENLVILIPKQST